MEGALDERMTALERSVRRWRLLTIAAIAVAAASALALALAAGRTGEAVRARAFVLVDGSGQVLATLGESGGVAGLALFRSGEVVAMLSTAPDGRPSLGLHGTNGDRAILGPEMLQMRDRDRILAATAKRLDVRDASGSKVLFTTWKDATSPPDGKRDRP
jgi:hypothetical protein